MDNICVSVQSPKPISIGNILKEVNTIVARVAGEYSLPLEISKHETIVFLSKRKGKQSEVKWVWWLGIIIDEDLVCDTHWKNRVEKARKMLGALSSVGNTQWGISPNSWHQMYTGMI